MAGCSKKQYAIMMSSGSEGQKLASKMGSMEQEEFNKAFADLLQSDSAADASYNAEHSKWSKEDDEDYQDFDVTTDKDFDEDEEDDDSELERETQEALDDSYGYVDPYNGGQVVNNAYYEKYVKPRMEEESNKVRDALKAKGFEDDEVNQLVDEFFDKHGYNMSQEEMQKALKEYNKKPLHIQSLENQVARNPQYKEIADSLTDNKDMNDAYFYAFKDAYEKHGYEPSNKHISDELEDAYFRMQDDYRDRHGMNDSEWDWHGESAFEREYGTMEEFVNNGLEAHDKYFDNLNKPDATTYEGAEVIGGEDNITDVLKDKTPLTEKESKMISDNDVPDDTNENRLAEGGLKGRFERAGHEVTDVTDKSMIVDGKYKIVDVGNGGFDVYANDKKIANDIGNQKDFVTLIDEYESRQGAFTSSKGDNPYPGKQEKRWSDDLEDNEYTKEYRPDVERMDQQKADAIAKAMEEYVAENPTYGFINADQIKRYSEKLGLANMDDDELSQMWYDIDNVGGLYEHGKPYNKGGRELGDARSAFIELVNKEARDRRGGKTKEDALAKIKEWADEAGQYDLDDNRAYLTGQQGDYIQRAVDKHGITKSELRALHPYFFGENGYSQYGKEDENNDEKLSKELMTSLKMPGDEVERFLKDLPEDKKKILTEWLLNTKRM